MTNQEQYELICEKAKEYDKLAEVFNKTQVEITTLQNRCYSLTKGTMCAFCRYECEYKPESERKL
jgi:recombinational DNA repair protein RecR